MYFTQVKFFSTVITSDQTLSSACHSSVSCCTFVFLVTVTFSLRRSRAHLSGEVAKQQWRPDSWVFVSAVAVCVYVAVFFVSGACERPVLLLLLL